MSYVPRKDLVALLDLAAQAIGCHDPEEDARYRALVERSRAALTDATTDAIPADADEDLARAAVELRKRRIAERERAAAIASAVGDMIDRFDGHDVPEDGLRAIVGAAMIHARVGKRLLADDCDALISFHAFLLQGASMFGRLCRVSGVPAHAACPIPACLDGVVEEKARPEPFTVPAEEPCTATSKPGHPPITVPAGVLLYACDACGFALLNQGVLDALPEAERALIKSQDRSLDRALFGMRGIR